MDRQLSTGDEENEVKFGEDGIRPCPCCGRPISAGLFAAIRRVDLPIALQAFGHSDQASEIESHAGGVLTVHGRSFVPARVNLPLYWAESPVGATVWVETPYHLGDDFIRFQDGDYPHFQGSGVLGCDVPGFPGTLGATVVFEAHAGDEMARITWCSDMRVLMTGREDGFGHEQLVRLYRRLWGGDGDTSPDNPLLREAALRALEDHNGHFFAKKIEPLGRYAGIKAPEVLIRPPKDTGGEARLATIGIAEAMPGPQKVELVTATRNGGPAFEKSFSEFCFWSRREQNPPLQPGIIIPETQGAIPEHQNMAAWLIVSEFETGEGPLCPPPSVSGRATINYLGAIPITQEEYAFAKQHGVAPLQELLETAGVDITDLARDSCLP